MTRNRQIILITAALILLLPRLGFSDSGITIIKNTGKTVLLLDKPADDPGDSFIALKLTGEGLISLSDGTDRTGLRFSAGKTPADIYIYPELIGVFPEKIEITGNKNSFDLISAQQAGRDRSKPEPADIGHIIFSDFDDNKSWEVFRWNLLPQVLIFDTIDYEVQARLFKRLAFFVEKPGYTGRLVPNRELNGKHGWNAHDYKPDDLAAFFNKAAEENFPLNPEESELRGLLLSNGIITGGEETGFKAGNGAVLSVSRETLPNWRYRFLTHECLHGIFFTDEEYMKDMHRAFDRLQPEEEEFWKHLLDYRRYDVENRYLLVNEFMAYSLQQPFEEVDDYFKGFLYVRMTAARPWEKEFINDFENNFADSFRINVSEIEKILYSHTGRIAGHLANLYPEEIDNSFFDLFPAN